MEISNSLVFDLAPIPMWLEDLSEVKKQLIQWRAQGIVDLQAYLEEDQTRIKDCAFKIKIIKVNERTLELFEANDVQEVNENLDIIFQDDLLPMHKHHLLSLWQGQHFFVGETINHTLSGQPLELQVRSFILEDHAEDWSRVLVTPEDITLYKQIARREAQSRRIAETLFMRSPAALLMENFHLIKAKIDAIRATGITNFEAYMDAHPNFVEGCLNNIIVEDVNQTALELFIETDKEKFIRNFSQTLIHDQMHLVFRQQLSMLWDGLLTHQRETAFMAFDHTIRYVYLQFTVFPGYEHDWSKVQIALTDITARKAAERDLEYLSKHDSLTQLGNRSLYTEEIKRLEQKDLYPLSCIYIDLNGLKLINDAFGHTTGDELLKRTGKLLNKMIHNTPLSACRIGGDEFVILMPSIDQQDLEDQIQYLYELIQADNHNHQTQYLSFSMGFASRQAHESVKEMLDRADQLMYQNKQEYYRIYNRRQSSLEHINQL